MKNKIALAVTSSAILGTLLFSGVAFAQTTPANPGAWSGRGNHAPGVRGTVSAINGDILTVTSNGYGRNPTPATYTVDATNATVTKNGAASSVGGIAVGDMVSAQGTVSGTNVTATTIRDGMMGRDMGQMGMHAPGVFGTVASISGNSLTVTGKVGLGGTAGTTYTVDATNATVTKNGSSSSVSNIAVGDTVMVAGTVSGTNVTATAIRDGMPQGKGPGAASALNSTIKGNGQPVIGGAVTALNGSILTVTNKSNVTYTVDATNATVTVAGAASSVGSVNIGDNVIVQGTVNGSSVTASSVVDQGAAQTATANTNTTTGTPAPHMGGGFMGMFGGLFQRLFGFF
jgi:hypothetical protein